MTPAPRPEDTSLDTAIANQLASTQIIVAMMNDRVVAKYKLDCANAAISYTAHAGDASIVLPPWPKVPNKWVIGPPNEFGFQFAVESKDPACDPIAPPDTSNYDHGTAGIAQAAYLKDHHPLAVGETAMNPPPGTEMTNPADGSKWQKKVLGISPFGVYCEWVRIG